MAIPTRPSPKSHHVSDPLVQPFLAPTFDPATYLNNTLPSLSLAARPPPGNANLPELSSQTQTLLSQLNAQTARLSNSLTQLTDEIIRSGGRLAYEVEVLRGETTGLTDTLENGLKKDIELLAPSAAKESNKSTPEEPEAEKTAADTEDASKPAQPTARPSAQQPTYLTSLQTLSTLRARLDSVIRVFGSATAWPAAPSEISSASSFISVTGPAETEQTRERERKAKEYTDELRAEMEELLCREDDGEGVEAATRRVEELRALAGVWKGTAEEKARTRVVEGLGKMVEERRRARLRGEGARGATNKGNGQPERGVDMRYGDLDSRAEGGYGFLQNLRNLKDGMYLD